MIKVVVISRRSKERSIFSPQASQRLARSAARQAPRLRQGIVEIILVGERSMAKLNRQFRGQNRATDVLSFAWKESAAGLSAQAEFLGQIFLCPSYIRRQARRFRVPWREEIKRSAIHGLLHLSGYDHISARGASIMFKLQENILANLM